MRQLDTEGDGFGGLNFLKIYRYELWCFLINDCLIVSGSFILIFALLSRKESRYDFYLLSIPLFGMIHQGIDIPYRYYLIWTPGEANKAREASLANILDHTLGLKQIPHLIFSVMIFKAALVLTLEFRERDNETRKRKLSRINRFSVFLTVLAVIMAISWQEFVQSTGNYTKWPSIVYATVQGLFLVVAVFYLRKSINTIDGMHASFAMLMLHLVNFIILEILWLVNCLMNYYYRHRVNMLIVLMVNLTYFTYMTLVIFFLVNWISKNKQFGVRAYKESLIESSEGRSETNSKKIYYWKWLMKNCNHNRLEYGTLDQAIV